MNVLAIWQDFEFNETGLYSAFFGNEAKLDSASVLSK